MPGPGPLDESSAMVVPVVGALPEPLLSTELVGGDAEGTVCGSTDAGVVATVVSTANASTTELSVVVEAGAVVTVVSTFGFSHTDRVVGAPRDGNNVSRTVHAAALPPTAVKQYSSQPTIALVRRRDVRGAESRPRNTLRIEARSRVGSVEPLIIGCSPEPLPWP